MSPVAAEVASADRAPALGVDPPAVEDRLPAGDGEPLLELADEPQPDAGAATAAHAMSVVSERSMRGMLQPAPELLLNASSPRADRERYFGG